MKSKLFSTVNQLLSSSLVYLILKYEQVPILVSYLGLSHSSIPIIKILTCCFRVESFLLQHTFELSHFWSISFAMAHCPLFSFFPPSTWFLRFSQFYILFCLSDWIHFYSSCVNFSILVLSCVSKFTLKKVTSVKL